MKKKIVKVSPMGMGHLMLELEDGTKQSVHRGDQSVTICVVGLLVSRSGLPAPLAALRHRLNTPPPAWESNTTLSPPGDQTGK